MLDMGVPVNVRDAFGNTILSVSCQNGHKRVAKVRLVRTPRLVRLKMMPWRPIQAALRRGADINARNFRGNTPL